MTKIPLPGVSVRGSDTGRPIMALLDLLGRRWALRILWELSQEAQGFAALQRRIDMSPTSLNQRLKELVQADLVEQSNDKIYLLTEQGQSLSKVLEPLRLWSEDWARNLDK